jgi:hypothetical protein
MMTLRAFVVWGEGYEPQPILDFLEYQAPEPAYPNGRVLIVGCGQCPLWADRAQVVLA